MYLGPYQRPAQLHSATAQHSPQGSSMKGLNAVLGIGKTAVLYIVLMIRRPNRSHTIAYTKEVCEWKTITHYHFIQVWLV